ncbi:hypothetical protein E4U26_008028 [Claviceps purpurea]|nr:hypothetical protein E4U26_008028 [Claviceps purpurea]
MTFVSQHIPFRAGFEVLQQLLARRRPYRIIDARNTEAAVQAIEKLDYDRTFHTVVVLSLDLCDLSKVKTFARQAQETVGQDKIDYLLLNAGMMKAAVEKQPYTSKWCESALFPKAENHIRDSVFLASVFLLAPNESSPVGNIEEQIRAGSGANGFAVYNCTKFIQLIGAHWWCRQLQGHCHVVVASPGRVYGTGLGREHGYIVPADAQYVVAIKHGASFILNGMFIDELPDEPGTHHFGRREQVGVEAGRCEDLGQGPRGEVVSQPGGVGEGCWHSCKLEADFLFCFFRFLFLLDENDRRKK